MMKFKMNDVEFIIKEVSQEEMQKWKSAGGFVWKYKEEL